MRYYRLKQDLEALEVFIKSKSHFEGEESLKRGLPMPSNLQPPFLFNIEMDEDEAILPSFDTAGPIFHRQLVEALQKTGVDNLEIFPALVNNSQTGEVIEDYVAVNIVGLVSSADMEKSDSEPLADVHFFFDLAIDPEKTKGLLMFRLAEQPMDIIVHEKVAKSIQEGNFTGIILEPVSEK